MLTNISHSVTDGCTMWNYSDHIWVSLRHLTPGTDAVAAQWSHTEPGKQGGWSQQGCQLVHTDSSTSLMRCSVLGNYAVLQVTEAYSVKSGWLWQIVDENLIQFMFHFSLGSSHLPKLQLSLCEGAPPCGLRMHCSAASLPLHHHHYAHTTPQVVCWSNFVLALAIGCFFLIIFSSVCFLQFHTDIKKKLAHSAEYLFPHRHDISYLCRRHKPNQLSSCLSGSMFYLTVLFLTTCMLSFTSSHIAAVCDRWVSLFTTPLCQHCCGLGSAPGSFTKRLCGEHPGRQKESLPLHLLSDLCSGQWARHHDPILTFCTMTVLCAVHMFFTLDSCRSSHAWPPKLPSHEGGHCAR